MSCTTCGSNVPCGCLPASDPCSTSYGGTCTGNTVPGVPQPYFACAPICQESNTQKVVINQFAQALKVANSWNVPACGLTATLSIPGLVSIVIGSYLWNETYGYFEVTAFDSGLQQVTVINNCNEGNAAAGTAVPACTEFINTAPPAADEDPNTPCVAIDFTAPAVSACIDITLNNTTGITSGDTIQIGSGFYRVAEVKPNDIINICNDGDGITPGTSVIAIDASGNFNYCLQIISSNPCTRDIITNGRLVVCDGNDQLTTIEAPEDGWILEGGADSDNWGGIPIGLVPFCSRLTAPLSIISGTATYTIAVVATGWIVGDILTVASYQNSAGIPATRFTVTNVPDGTHVTGTFDPVPPASVTIPTGTNICRIGCCEYLDNAMAEVACTPPIFRLDVGTQQFTVPVTLDGDNYFEAIVDTSLIPIDISGADCLDGYYAIVAHISIATLADFGMVPVDLSELGVIYHEVDLAWTVGSVPANFTAGKIVYTDVLGDSLQSGATPISSGATLDQMPSPAPNYPLNYHQCDVAALAILPPGTTMTNLGLSYRTVVGVFEFAGLSYFDSMSFMVSGWVDIYKVNG